MDGILEALAYAPTCGEACWCAEGDVCRCSCHGKNHACLRDGGTRPERTSRRKSYVYKLYAVISCEEKSAYFASFDADKVTRQIIAQTFPTGNPKMPMRDYTTNEPTGRLYCWGANDDGIPALSRLASESQMKWTELQAYSNRPILVWARWDLIGQLEAVGA